MGATPKIATPTPAPSPDTQAASTRVQGAQNQAWLNAMSAAGQSSTLLTGAQGLTQTATNAPKSLLGG